MARQRLAVTEVFIVEKVAYHEQEILAVCASLKSAQSHAPRWWSSPDVPDVWRSVDPRLGRDEWLLITRHDIRP